MDPNVALERLLDAIREGDLERMRSNAHNLREWISKGGFAPNVTPHELSELLGAIEALIGGFINEPTP